MQGVTGRIVAGKSVGRTQGRQKAGADFKKLEVLSRQDVAKKVLFLTT